jgi:hypothetical protein
MLAYKNSQLKEKRPASTGRLTKYSRAERFDMSILT